MPAPGGERAGRAAGRAAGRGGGARPAPLRPLCRSPPARRGARSPPARSPPARAVAGKFVRLRPAGKPRPPGPCGRRPRRKVPRPRRVAPAGECAAPGEARTGSGAPGPQDLRGLSPQALVGTKGLDVHSGSPGGGGCVCRGARAPLRAGSGRRCLGSGSRPWSRARAAGIPARGWGAAAAGGPLPRLGSAPVAWLRAGPGCSVWSPRPPPRGSALTRRCVSCAFGTLNSPGATSSPALRPGRST